jgi:NADPH-dependent 2,4-dienoyl-CoA reductase/sulfur reductase-like enzyme/nitrite reductase/ring-hydroxylating ferredoxin subunit
VLQEVIVPDKTDPPALDLRAGVALAELPDGAIRLGRVGAEQAILLRAGEQLFAVGALCPHYHAALSAGLVVDGALRCPMHHSSFDLRTGEALRAPALDPLPCWRVERVEDRIFVRERLAQPRRAAIAAEPASSAPRSVVIIGGGGAGLAAADMLRRAGYPGTVTMLSADDEPPCDRPNLSKDFLAGTAPADWMPLRPPGFYADNHIDLVLRARVSSLDARNKRVHLEDGRHIDFDALLIATGTVPIRLEIPGAGEGKLHYLRSFADGKALLAKAASARRAIVVGTSFIGLEVAASLRARGIAVHVVGPGKTPLEPVLGAELGQFIQGVHESHGVQFHLERTVQRMDGNRVTLSDGTALDADLVVLGVGVQPEISLAKDAGLTIDRGIAVDAYLQTSVPGIYAAGDVARWPDAHSGERIRVEHWAVAQRQGQVAARNMVGRRERFDAVPFFWSQHFDVVINYVGHAQSWDRLDIEGTLASRDCAVRFSKGERTLAIATIGRDRQSLRCERELEQGSSHPNSRAT